MDVCGAANASPSSRHPVNLAKEVVVYAGGPVGGFLSLLGCGAHSDRYLDPVIGDGGRMGRKHNSVNRLK